jgi:hypothetical protein
MAFVVIEKNFQSMIFIARACIVYRGYDACAVTFVYSSVDVTRLNETTCVTRAMVHFRFREQFCPGIKRVREESAPVRKIEIQTFLILFRSFEGILRSAPVVTSSHSHGRIYSMLIIFHYMNEREFLRAIISWHNVIDINF